MFQYIFKTWEQALAFAYPIRHQVFVIEQKIPENLEIDEHDLRAQHLILLFNQKPVGTARMYREDKDISGSFKIGRLAILQEFRGKGLGKKMMQYLLAYAEENHYSEINIHAQLYALPFYENLGFIAHSEKFYEDGILHTKCTFYPPQIL